MAISLSNLSDAIIAIEEHKEACNIVLGALNHANAQKNTLEKRRDAGGTGINDTLINKVVLDGITLADVRDANTTWNAAKAFFV